MCIERGGWYELESHPNGAQNARLGWGTPALVERGPDGGCAACVKSNTPTNA